MEWSFSGGSSTSLKSLIHRIKKLKIQRIVKRNPDSTMVIRHTPTRNPWGVARLCLYHTPIAVWECCKTLSLSHTHCCLGVLQDVVFITNRILFGVLQNFVFITHPLLFGSVARCRLYHKPIAVLECCKTSSLSHTHCCFGMLQDFVFITHPLLVGSVERLRFITHLLLFWSVARLRL